MVLAWKDPAALLALLLAMLAVLLASPHVSTAEASACQRWAHDNPGTLSHPEARKAVMCVIDKKRRSHGKPDLDHDRRLQRAAQNHTEYMKRHRCFSHECSGEKSVLGRLQAVNYITSGVSRWAYGENIVNGQGRRGTPAAVVDAWMRSAPHRANILSGTFRDVGIGFVEGTPSNPQSDGGTYTADFGLRSG